MRLIGILLIVFGIIALGFNTITFFTTERAVDAWPLKIDVQKPHTIVLNPIAGAVAVGTGLILVVAGRRSSSV